MFNFADNLKATKFNTRNTISHIKLEWWWNEDILYCCGTDEAVSSYISEVLSDKNLFGKQIESVYWIGQRYPSGFHITSYGKPWTNALANPMLKALH